MGSKKKLQKHIAPIINKLITDNNISTYIEPFVGGANMIEVVNCYEKIGYDNNEYLISLLNYVSNNGLDNLPNEITREHYSNVRTVYNNGGIMFPKYYIGYIGFMGSYNGRFFDGGYSGHDVKEKGKEKGRDFIRQTINNLESQLENIKDIKFKTLDFKKIDVKGCLIYCDPPYKNTKKYLTSKNFDYYNFYEWVRKMSKNNIVLVSEYEMPVDFEVIWSKETKTNMMDTMGGIRKTNIEKLFIYKGDKQ